MPGQRSLVQWGHRHRHAGLCRAGDHQALTAGSRLGRRGSRRRRGCSALHRGRLAFQPQRVGQRLHQHGRPEQRKEHARSDLREIELQMRGHADVGTAVGSGHAREKPIAEHTQQHAGADLQQAHQQHANGKDHFERRESRRGRHAGPSTARPADSVGAAVDLDPQFGNRPQCQRLVARARLQQHLLAALPPQARFLARAHRTDAGQRLP